MYIMLLTVGVLLFSSLPAFAQQDNKSEAQEKASSPLFYYRDNSKVLSLSHETNEFNYQLLKEMIKDHRKDLIAGKSHLRILSHLFPRDINDLKAVNNGSIQGNIMHSLLRMRFLPENTCFTFYFDTLQVKRNCVSVVYMPYAIPKDANQNIFYTFSKHPYILKYSVSRYGKLPIIGGERGSERKSEKPVIKGEKPLDKNLEENIRPENIYEDVDSVSVPEEIAPDYITKETFHPLLAFKTNALYWCGITPEFKRRKVLPNIEAELYLGKHWSLNADITYVYLNRQKPEKEIWGVFGVGIEPRYWLCGSGRFSGAYAGLYGLYGNFDVKPAGISSEGTTGDFAEGGLSVGYALMLSKHWGFEIGGRFGYRFTDGDHYQYIEPDYCRLNSYTENKFKLTGIRLLLVYRIGKTK